MDPASGAIIASLISAAAQGGMAGFGASKAKKAGKIKAEEMKRETYASLLNDSLQRNADLEGHRLSSNARMGKSGSQNLMNTSTLLREAFGI